MGLYVVSEGGWFAPEVARMRREIPLADQAGRDITYKVYVNLGHSLMSWRGLFTMGFPPGYLETLGAWSHSKIAGTDTVAE